MKFGISAFAWTDRITPSHFGIFAEAQARGLQCVEVAMFDADTLPLRGLRDAAAAAGVAITVCSILPSDINPISPDVDVRRKSIRHLQRCLYATAEMGSSLLGGPILAPIAYLPGHRPTQEEHDWAVQYLRAAIPTAEQLGISICIEPVNRSETFFVRSVAEACLICEEVSHPLLGVTIDTFHANIEESSIVATIAAAGCYVKHMHLSENHRGTIGSGHIDFGAILGALNQIGYTGFSVIEGFGYVADECTSPGYLWAPRDLTPKQFLQDSVSFLRKLVV